MLDELQGNFMPRNTRPNEYDTKCPDGFTCYGWRRVNKGGYVRFSHGKHYHDELKQYVGKWVYVILADMWGNNVQVFTEKPFDMNFVLDCYNPDYEAALEKSAPVYEVKERSTAKWPFEKHAKPLDNEE